jgi:hypothetical protein
MIEKNVKNIARVYETALDQIETNNCQYQNLISSTLIDLEEIGQIHLDMSDEDHQMLVADTFYQVNKILRALSTQEIYS